MRPLDPRLIAHAKSARSHLLTAVAIGIATAVAVIAQATVLGHVVADVFAGNTAGVPHAVVWVAALGGVRALLSWAAEATAHRASAQVKSELRRATLAHIASLGPTWVATQRTSDVATTLVRGLDALDHYFARYLPSLVLAAVVPAAGGMWILRQDALSAVIIAITVPLVPFFMVLVGRFTAGEADRQWRSLQVLAGHFLDVVTGVTTLKAFNRSEGQASALHESGESYRVATMRVLRVSFLSVLVLELISTISVALVAVSIGLRLDSGQFSLRQGLVILILVPEVYLPLRAVGTNFHAAAEGLEAAARVFDILETPAPVAGNGRLPVGAGREITLRKAHFTYPDGINDVLGGFSAQFHAGQVSVLTGPSGCGKTTVLSLITALRQAEPGTVLIDGTDVTHFEPSSLRSAISYLPQTPWIAYGTVRQALCAAGPLPDERLAHICKRVGIDDLADGLDTVVSRSTGLSTGQRRRLALARVLLRNTPIVLLDEPTASVDAATEQLVSTIMRELADEGRLVLAVSHRPPVIAAADNVVTVGAL